jgi:hypothetical protein
MQGRDSCTTALPVGGRVGSKDASALAEGHVIGQRMDLVLREFVFTSGQL